MIQTPNIPTPAGADVNRFAEIIRDPVMFARSMLRHNTWSMQEAILRSVARNPRTAVKACHASSKTFTAAELVLWWLLQYPDAKAVTTASSFTQVKQQLWVEMKRAAVGSVIQFPKMYTTEMRYSSENYAIGISTNQGVRFQGFHGRILVIIDEAPGVEPEIWEAIESARAGGDVHLLVLGNPTIIGGPFYDCFHSKREFWSTFSMDAFDSPNFEGITLEVLLQLDDHLLDENPLPYLITRRWVKEKYYEWGVDDPRWLPRVRGQFPRASSNQVISLEDVEACVNIEPRLDGRRERVAHFGGDIARFGDDKTVFCGVINGRLAFLEDHRKQDTMETVGQIKRIIEEKKREGLFGSFAIDDGGLGGGVTDRLHEMQIETIPMSFGSTAYREDEYVDLRTEMWWHMRRLFVERRVSIPNEPELIGQLVAPTYRFMSNGKIRLESKEDMKKRGLRSPDHADALAMALYPRQWIARVAAY